MPKEDREPKPKDGTSENTHDATVSKFEACVVVIHQQSAFERRNQ